MSDSVIKCVRCNAEATFGDFATNADITKEAYVALVIGQLGWRQTFAGWQCPNHRPAGREPPAIAIEARQGEDASAASSRSDESAGPQDIAQDKSSIPIDGGG